MTKVSIVIPAYNVENYIGRTLDSIKKQEFKDFEVIIIDDKSTDNTRNIIKKFSEHDTRFKLYTSIKNQGVSASRNEGVKYASGEFIFFIDGDDYISKDGLSLIASKLNDAVDVVMVNYDLVDFYGKKIKHEEVRFFEEDFPDHDVTGIDAVKMLFTHKISHWPFEIIIRKSIIVENNIWFPEDRVYGEDFATTYKKLFYSRNISFLNENIYKYVQRKSSAMHNHRLNDSVDYFNSILDLDVFIKKNAPELELEKAYYILPRLINAYSIQCKFPKEQDRQFMVILRREILKNNNLLKNSHFMLSKRDQTKVILIKLNLLNKIYLISFYKNKIRNSNGK